MLPSTFSQRSSGYDFAFYRMLAIHLGQRSDVPESLEGASAEIKEELEAVRAAAEYLTFAQAFFALVERECAKAKADIQTQGVESVIHRMPALISLVNSVGYLRGQDGMFRDEHPRSVSDTQNLLYKMEGRAEDQLNEIIQLLLASDATKERYKERLMNYFVRSRSGEKPSSIW